MLLGDSEGAGSAEDYQVQQRVGTKPVSAMNAGTGRLTAGVQSRNHIVLSAAVSDHLMGIMKGVLVAQSFCSGDVHN